MITNTVQIEKSIQHLVNYSWKDEMKSFQECFEREIQSQDDIEDWIIECEKHDDMKNHAFYHLMILKSAYPQLFE